MDWPRNRRPKGLPPGEYVVRHERPYPERLDRAFRIGASVVGALALVGMLALLSSIVSTATTGKLIAISILVVVLPALAYAAVWAAGALLIGIVVAFRRKQYIVNWEEGPPER